MITEAEEKRADRRRWRGYAYTAVLLVVGLGFTVATSPELSEGDAAGVQPIDLTVSSFDDEDLEGRALRTYVVGTDRGRRTQVMTSLTNDGLTPVRIDQVLVAGDLEGGTVPCAWKVEETYVGRGHDRFTTETTTTPLGDGVSVGRGETITLRMVGSLPSTGHCRTGQFAALTYVDDLQVRATVAGRSTYRSVPLGLRFAWTDDPTRYLADEDAETVEP